MSPIYDMDAVNGAPDEVGRQPGLYYAEISAAAGKVSTNGKNMVNLDIVEVNDRSRLCFDRLMLEGKPFALTMTKKKLQALGVDVSKPLDPMVLVGRRFWLSLEWGEPNEKGRTYLEPNFKAKDSAFGYYPDGERPGADESQASNLFGPGSTLPGADDVPFAILPFFFLASLFF